MKASAILAFASILVGIWFLIHIVGQMDTAAKKRIDTGTFYRANSVYVGILWYPALIQILFFIASVACFLGFIVTR